MVHASNNSTSQRKRRVTIFYTITLLLVTLQIGLLIYYSLKSTYTVSLDYECQGFPLMTKEEEKNAPIPRIVHQTWKNSSVPPQWSHCVVSWNNTVWKDGLQYQYMLWTDDMLLEFLTQEFPWFLPTYNNYRFPIQKVDAARLFLLYKFGGVYVDMDIQREEKWGHTVAEFRRFQVVFPQTDVGLSNDFMMAAPGHPLLKQMIEDLPYSDHWYYILPFLHVFLSGGPLFVTRHYNSFHPKDGIYIINGMCYHRGIYISHWTGSTWHRWDSRLLNMIWEQEYGLVYIILIIFAALLLPLLVFRGIYKIIRKFWFRECNQRGNDNWLRLANTL